MMLYWRFRESPESLNPTRSAGQSVVFTEFPEKVRKSRRAGCLRSSSVTPIWAIITYALTAPCEDFLIFWETLNRAKARRRVYTWRLNREVKMEIPV